MKPLYEALCKYSGRAAAVFHMPGHKLGRGFAADSVFARAASIDVTELAETDDLHSPEGPLKEAQELAAAAFGAGRTWFLVNGSSCGIMAMVAAKCSAGQKLLIARDFHYSTYNAIRFARAVPVYLPAPSGDSSLFADAVERAVAGHPDAAALYLTRPGYYGNVCDIEAVARIAHKKGIPVLVDEAHGAHLAFSEKLPISALEGGADYCIESAHKTLPAFTQCAYAHASAAAAKEDGLGVGIFSEALRAFQTSSPSFVLTASLDYAREYMAENGGRELARVAGKCESFYDRAAAAGYGIPADIRGGAAGNGGAPGRYGRDMTRLTLDAGPLGLTGVEVERLLWSQFDIKIEMSDLSNIVMITTVADKDCDIDSLADALCEIARKYGVPCGPEKCLSNSPVNGCAIKKTYDISAPVIKPDFIADLHMRKRYMPLACACGYTAAEIVTPYPPGVPVLCPGEPVTAESAGLLLSLMGAGVRVRGADAKTGEIAVFDTEERPV